MGEPARDFLIQLDSDPSSTLKLLSYNIQAGVETSHYREYVTKSWKHVLPHKARLENLNRIATLLTHYDLVGLQEVDAGSLRSGFVDQTEYLAHMASYPHWYKQINRNMGKLAQHSNGVLSRIHPVSVTEYKLPGLPGRGAMLIELATNGEPVMVCIMHLALGRRARARQLGYIGELVSHYPYLVLMGDFNCGCESPDLKKLVASASLRGAECEMKTFPSWRPYRNLDHILVSDSLEVAHAQVLDYPLSDHLPVSMQIRLPEGLTLNR